VKLSSKIKVKLPCGREIDLTNTITYGGVDVLTRAIANKKIIEITHLYLRHATVSTDADDPATNFGESKNIKAVWRKDFEQTNGSARLDILPLGNNGSIGFSDRNKYGPNHIDGVTLNNEIVYEVSFSPSDLTNFMPADSAQNYSNVYYMGLASRIQGQQDRLFSVMKLKEGEYFGIPSGGQVDVRYKLILDF
jgi:hypothetical protein